MKYLINLKKDSSDAILPTQSVGNVGFDLSSIEEGWIPPGECKLIDTGLIFSEPIKLNNGFPAFAKIEGRSGLASKGIFTTGGIIDTDLYRGRIKVILYNFTKQSFRYEKGHRIAQMIIYPAIFNSIDGTSVEFVETNEVQQTDRADKGFGSSGI